MGLVNARNLRKAKQLLEKNRGLLEKNRHKVGDVVGKATTKLDEVSGGKTANLSKKAEEAARKYSAGGGTLHDIQGGHVVAAPAPGSGPVPQPPPSMATAGMSEEMLRHQAEVNLAAADALTAAAKAMLDTADEISSHDADT
jgi:hypothetical protein